MKRWFITVVVLLGVAGAGLGTTAPAASGASTSCRVVNTSSGRTASSLQDAVDAAAPGDTLFVKGICTGSTYINKDLTISGHSASGTKTATLSCNCDSNDDRGSVLAIVGADVTLNSLII